MTSPASPAPTLSITYTLKITLKNPVAGFLGYVANINGGNMVCKKAAEEMGDGFSKKPIGTGPFMFAEYQPQQFVRLVANKQYFRGAPMLDEIMYRYIPSDSSRDLAFQSGELDMIYGKQDQSWVDRTKQTPGVKVLAMEPGELSTLFLNITQKPLDDIRVREAIAYARRSQGDRRLQGRRHVARGGLGRALRLSRHGRARAALPLRPGQGEGASEGSRLSGRRHRSRPSTRR